MKRIRFRIWAEFEDGSGERYTVSLNFPIFEPSIAEAERAFKERMVRGWPYGLMWEMDFDLTGNANGMRDCIDMVWTGTARAEQWDW